MKQQLTEALMAFENLKGKEVVLSGRYIIEDAARLVERLLPGVCENCDRTGGFWSGGEEMPQYSTCPVCHGSGRVWDEGIVEVVAKAMHDVVYDGSLHPDSWEMQTQDHKEDERRQARFVLSALVELTEKVER